MSANGFALRLCDLMYNRHGLERAINIFIVDSRL